MEILVLNATNWVGYHVTERLLGEGYQVKGVKDPKGNDDLAEFFVRNSNFKWVTNEHKGVFDVGICALDSIHLKDYTFRRLFVINGEPDGTKNATVCHVPSLFGKWMKISEENRKLELEENGIYVEDFLDIFIPFIESPPPQKEIHFRPKRKQSKILEKYCFVHENSPIDEKIEEVFTHYERFQN